MIFLDVIAEYAPAVDAYAKHYGGRATTIVSPPATLAGVVACERTLGYRLPPDFRSFLTECNGLISTMYGPQGLEMYTVDIFGTARLVQEFMVMRKTIEEEPGNYDRGAFSKLLFFSGSTEGFGHFFQTLGADRWQIVVRYYRSGEFLNDKFPPIADTFSEYLEKSLVSMKNGFGCYYYEDRSLAEDITKY